MQLTAGFLGSPDLGTATTKAKPNTIILHSRVEEIVLYADSDLEELVANSGLSPEVLIEVGVEHRLADEESLEAMLRACWIQRVERKTT